MTQTKRLTQSEITAFFFPLLLNVQMMSVSHSIINAGLARMNDAVTVLAAFSVAMVLHLFVASPSYQNHTVTIAMVRDRRSLLGTVFFVGLVALWVSILLGLIAFTPLGTFVLIDLLGVTPIVAEGAREALALLVFLPFITGPRGLFQGLVIQARRTGLVSFATGIRILSLFAFLWMGYLWFDGTRVAAFALLCCVLTETVVIGFFAWKVHLPATNDPEKSPREVLRYAFPLAYSSGLQQAVPLLINAIISRLPDRTMALAAFGCLASQPLGAWSGHWVGQCHAILYHLAYDGLRPVPSFLRCGQLVPGLVCWSSFDGQARPLNPLQGSVSLCLLAVFELSPSKNFRRIHRDFPSSCRRTV